MREHDDSPSGGTSQQSDVEMKALWADALLSPLWESNAHNPTPAPRRGHVWRWEDIRKFAGQAARLTSPDVVERRVLRLVNPQPTVPDDESTIGNLAAAIQVLLPGEKARPHRHSINALRFVLQGKGATTYVNGKPLKMAQGDMLLTPGACWHEHSHDGDEPVIWLDALDAPLHNKLGIVTFEPGPVKDRHPTVPEGAFASPNVLPVTIESDYPYSPVFAYPLSHAAAALEHAPPGRDGTRAVRYVNPMTGGAPMPTIDCRLIALDPEVETVPYCCNASVICLVVEGEGETWLGEERHAWGKFDIIAMPQNSWVRHKASSPARLLRISDSEALRRLEAFEERFAEQE